MNDCCSHNCFKNVTRVYCDGKVSKGKLFDDKITFFDKRNKKLENFNKVKSIVEMKQRITKFMIDISS